MIWGIAGWRRALPTLCRLSLANRFRFDEPEPAASFPTLPASVFPSHADVVREPTLPARASAVGWKSCFFPSAGRKRTPIPKRPDQTIWEVLEEDWPKLIPYRGRFDGFHALPASVSKTCLVRFDNNKYSVSATAVGRAIDIHAYAGRIVMRQEGRAVAETRLLGATDRNARDHCRVAIAPDRVNPHSRTRSSSKRKRLWRGRPRK